MEVQVEISARPPSATGTIFSYPPHPTSKSDGAPCQAGVDLSEAFGERLMIVAFLFDEELPLVEV